MILWDLGFLPSLAAGTRSSDDLFSGCAACHFDCGCRCRSGDQYRHSGQFIQRCCLFRLAIRSPHPLIQNPAISLSKSADVAAYDTVGQVITYTYTIRNSGNVSLAGPFTVSDDRQGILTNCAVGPLAPAATTTCTSTHTVTQGRPGCRQHYEYRHSFGQQSCVRSCQPYRHQPTTGASVPDQEWRTHHILCARAGDQLHLYRAK